MDTPSTELTKSIAQKLFEAWIKQRPGLDWCNYDCGDYTRSRACYRSELRNITKDLHRARKAFESAFFDYTPFDADLLLDACRHAYSGRLTLEPAAKGWRISYCTGQYFPTEYRQAAASVLEEYNRLLNIKYYSGN